MTQAQHTTGALQAANIIRNNIMLTNEKAFIDFMAKTIDEETNADDMLAFIEKVASGEWGLIWELESDYSNACMNKAQAEAFELIKKVRG